MIPRTHARVRRRQRHPWSRSVATALGGGILIDAPIIRGEIDLTSRPGAGVWIPLAAR